MDKEKLKYCYEVVESELESAYSKLREVINILNSDLIIDRNGYCADDIKNIRENIYNYNIDINNRIFPAIDNLNK